jgi:hypothetical protein
MVARALQRRPLLIERELQDRSSSRNPFAAAHPKTLFCDFRPKIVIVQIPSRD